MAGFIAPSPPPPYQQNNAYYLEVLSGNENTGKPKDPSPYHHDNEYAEIDSKRIEPSGIHSKHASRQSKLVCCLIITVVVIVLLCGVSGGGVALFYRNTQNQNYGVWSPWSAWGECICAEAEDCKQFRSRQCIVNGNYGDDADCLGNNAEARECDIEACAGQPCQEEMTRQIPTVQARTFPDQPLDPQPTGSDSLPDKTSEQAMPEITTSQVTTTRIARPTTAPASETSASLGTCQINHLSTSPAAAHASYLGTELDTYQCVTEETSLQSIHVLSVYEGSSNTRPPSAGDMNVVIQADSSGDKPVVLVLASYEPVRWILDVPDIVILDEIILLAYYLDESSIGWASRVRSDVPITRSRSIPRGYGPDVGTVGLLNYLRDNYGPVNSFTGTYRADHWTLDISYGDRRPGEEGGIPPTTPADITNDIWTLYSFTYDNNWNDCNGLQYVKSTGLDVGAYVGVVLCSATRYKIFLSDDLSSTFRNVADGGGHGQDHCQLVGAQEDDPVTIDSDFWESPAIVGYYRYEWGEDFEIGNIGGGTGDTWTGNYYVKWYECGVPIP